VQPDRVREFGPWKVADADDVVEKLDQMAFLPEPKRAASSGTDGGRQ